MDNTSISSLSGFSSATIRQRVNKARIDRDDPPEVLAPEVPAPEVLALFEALWRKSTGITLQRNDLRTSSADALYRHAHANLFETLVIIAPPRILGNLRKAFHPEVVDRIAAEIPKELTAHPLAEIEKLIAA